MLIEHRLQTVDPFLVQSNPIPSGLATSLSAQLSILILKTQAYFNQRFFPEREIVFNEQKWPLGKAWLWSWKGERKHTTRTTHTIVFQ